MELYYEAFWELNTARAVGFGTGPIPWQAVDTYATRHTFDEEQREDLFYYLRAMDQAYIKHVTKAGKRGNQ